MVVPKDGHPTRNTESLRDEVRVLAKELHEALETATFIPMSDEESAQYDERRERLSEIARLLNRPLDGLR